MHRIIRRFIGPSQSHNVVYGIGVQQHSLLYSTSVPSNELTDCFTRYLVDSLGFSHQQALSVSVKFFKFGKVNDLKFDSKANSVVGFFKNHGFDDTHIRKIVSFHPLLLCSKVELTLKPKIQYLQDLSFTESDIIQVISGNPRLLLSGSESSIVPTVKILRQVLVCESHVIAVIEKIRRLAFSCIIENLLPNIALLSGYGIPIEMIRKRILHKPGPFLRKPEKFKDLVITVEKKLGIRPDSIMFLYGLQLLSGFSEENIKSKCRVFKSFGWTQRDVEILIMKHSTCFTFSDATIKKKLDYLMNELHFKPAFLTSNSALLTCSLEKRLIPRHKVLLVLKENGLLKKNPALCTAIHMSESRFLNKFVRPFEEVHGLYAKLTGCNMKTLIQQ